MTIYSSIRAHGAYFISKPQYSFMWIFNFSKTIIYSQDSLLFSYYLFSLLSNLLSVDVRICFYTPCSVLLVFFIKISCYVEDYISIIDCEVRELNASSFLNFVEHECDHLRILRFYINFRVNFWTLVKNAIFIFIGNILNV